MSKRKLLKYKRKRCEFCERSRCDGDTSR